MELKSFAGSLSSGTFFRLQRPRTQSFVKTFYFLIAVQAVSCVTSAHAGRGGACGAHTWAAACPPHTCFPARWAGRLRSLSRLSFSLLSVLIHHNKTHLTTCCPHCSEVKDKMAMAALKPVFTMSLWMGKVTLQKPGISLPVAQVVIMLAITTAPRQAGEGCERSACFCFPGCLGPYEGRDAPHCLWPDLSLEKSLYGRLDGALQSKEAKRVQKQESGGLLWWGRPLCLGCPPQAAVFDTVCSGTGHTLREKTGFEVAWVLSCEKNATILLQIKIVYCKQKCVCVCGCVYLEYVCI